MSEDDYKELQGQYDENNFTPLMLCAARGSKEMFRHLFKKLLQPVLLLY